MQFYDKLSEFIGTRTSSQCRSHHQKLFAKFKYLSKIREIFKTQLGVTLYKSKLKQGMEKMDEIERKFLNRHTHEESEEPEEVPV